MKQLDILPGMPDALPKLPPKARDYEGMTLDEAIARSHALIDEVCGRWPAEHRILLFSGGGDSVVLAHLLRERATAMALINTTTRVPDTSQHVRAVAGAWNVELAEPEAPDSYRNLVCGRVLNRTGPNAGKVAWRGFPGPAKHGVMYQRLKERALERLRGELIGPRGKAGQIIYLDGMRWAESERRFRNADEEDRKGAIVWCSPIVHWTDGHMAEYRERHRCQLSHEHAEHRLCAPGSLPLNEVTVHLHMSGDCLCGSFAKDGEIFGLELFYPDSAGEIHDIEAEARWLHGRGLLDIPVERLTWGWGANVERPARAGRLCSACPVQMEGQQPLFTEDGAA